jgi:hypothetical protein
MWPRLVPMESGHNRTDEARIPGQSIPCFRAVSYVIGSSLLLSPLWRILRLSHQACFLPDNNPRCPILLPLIRLAIVGSYVGFRMG